MYPDGKSQSFFATSNGRRFIDRLSNKTAHEAKEGYTSATQFIKKRLKKILIYCPVRKLINQYGISLKVL